MMINISLLKGGEKVNVMGLLLNQSLPSTFPNHQLNEGEVGSKSEVSFLQQLVSIEQTSEELGFNAELNHLDFANVEDLLAKLNEMSLEQLNELHGLLADDTASIPTKDEMVEHLVSLIHNLLDEPREFEIPFWTQIKAAFQSSQPANHEQFLTNDIRSRMDSRLNIVQQDSEAIKLQLNEIFKQVESLLAKVTDEQDFVRVSPRMLELLEKWTTLANRYSSDTNQGYVLPSSTITESTSESRNQDVWKELVHNFQKRNSLASNELYQASAKVTTKDISKWLQNILNAQVDVENPMNTQSMNLSNQPLSKVEQYMIYMNQSESSQSVEKQFIDQFQQVMRTSRFLSLNNGINQMSIALRPDNLGEMMIRFTEINGEMTLKIIVSSQATRQMLESNIHQLKNMFAPHQVVIEEREVMIENVQTQSEEQELDDEKEHTNESNQEDSRNFEEEHETNFHDILMNEKV